MKTSYKTLQSPSEGVYKEKGSKFLAYAFPVYNESEINVLLEKIKKAHLKARHHCYAYKLGYDGKLFRANDDHEPKNSAGTPILNQIESKEMTTLLIIVVRYFGGTLLGKSGLTKAYKRAAATAVQNGAIVTRAIMDYYELKFEYDRMNDIMNHIKNHEFKIVKKDFADICYLLVAIPTQESEIFLNYLKKNDNLVMKFIESK